MRARSWPVRLLVAAAAVVWCGVAPARAATPEAVQVIAGTYDVARDGVALPGCSLDLTRSVVGRAAARTLRTVRPAPACRAAAPAVFAATGWIWTGGGSIALYGANGRIEIAHFSPVQDGTGVYLRGAAAGDAALIELRPREP